MLRVLLLKLGSQHHILALVMHHIASDGWSMDILTEELLALYEADVKDLPGPLAPLDIQYGDYSVWQRNHIGQEEYQRQLDFWKTKLEGIPATHKLPLDKRRPERFSYQGDRLVRHLDPELVASLSEYTRQHDVSLFMLMNTVFSALLGHWSGASDIVLGSPIAGRPHKQLESLIGCFLNTIAYRTQTDLGKSFTELLAEVKDYCLSAYAHQDVPFDSIVENMGIKRSLSHNPVFQIWLVALYQPSVIEIEGLSVSDMDIQNQTTQFDLQLMVVESGEGISISWTYSTALFNRSTIEKLSDCFNLLLTDLLQSPELPIRDVIAPIGGALLNNDSSRTRSKLKEMKRRFKA